MTTSWRLLPPFCYGEWYDDAEPDCETCTSSECANCDRYSQFIIYRGTAEDDG